MKENMKKELLAYGSHCCMNCLSSSFARQHFEEALALIVAQEPDKRFNFYDIDFKFYIRYFHKL